MYRGEVISMVNGELIALDRDGRERSNTLAADAQLTCDGNLCTSADIQQGMRIRVTTQPDSNTIAIGIEALDKKEMFEKCT